MPARISLEKESQITALYLQGLSQTEIARKLRLSQSTVSKAVSTFKKDASQNSPEEACSRRGVSDIFDELRSLSADLRRAGVTVDQAKRGYELTEELDRIDGDLDMLQDLLAVYRRIAPKEFPVEDFVQATIQIIRLEQEYGRGYKEMLSEYQGLDAAEKKLVEIINSLNRELAEITKNRGLAEADLKRYLEEKKLTLDKVEIALKVRQSLEKAGLDIEKSEAVGDTLKVFSDLIESKGLTSEKAAAELLKFLGDARSLEEAMTNIKNEITEATSSRDSLKAEVAGLELEKDKLAIENKFLKEAIESVLELREKYGIGVDEIAKIRSLAQKYGPPASILQALDTYKSLKDIEKQKAALEGSVEELIRNEASLKGKIEAAVKDLAALPAKTDQSIRAVESSLNKFSEHVQGLGQTIGKASTEVTKLTEKALATGREISSIESRLETYKLTSKFIDFVVNGKGEEAEVGMLATGFLGRLSKWAQGQPRLSETMQQIGSLREKIERQLILG